MTRWAASARSLAASAPTDPLLPLKSLRVGALLALATTVVSGLGQAPVRPGPRVTAGPSAPAQDDEFVGPFRSWTNLKTQYGAAGDGQADDTAALQKALDALATPGQSPVLFIPIGTYRITRTLALAYNISVNIVGEDPATTRIVWDGDAAGTMLRINGIAYSRFTRLTFDGRRKASVAVEQSWDGARPHFDTGNEYSDSSFLDLEYGIHGGFNDRGFAETSIRRSSFLRNTRAGIALGNFNALDIWVWDSTFEDCSIGVTNTTGAGNFHVYNSVFRRSTQADLAIGNTGGFSARGNYSAGSRAFFTGGGTNNPATIHIQGNTIVDPIDSASIRFGNQGPGLLTDNVIRSLPSATGPVVSWASFVDADVTSVGNTFTVRSPLGGNGRVVSIDDRIVARATIQPTEPVVPGPRPNLSRHVYEVPRGADAAAIQELIVEAAQQNGSRPVVHIPYGTYSIDETLTVPVSDMQLVGDGFGTVLRWAGTGTGPLLRIMGPSKATLRELQLDGMTRADGLVVENVDQPGSRVYMDQAQLRAAKQTSLWVDRLDHTNVQLEDFEFAYSPDAVSIKVIGGPSSSSGEAKGGKTNIFSGASSGNTISFDVSGGGKALVRDLWYEGGAGAGFAHVHDRAVFTIDGARISSPVNGTLPAFDIRNLNGRVAIVLSDIDDKIVVSGDGTRAMVMGLGVLAERRSSTYFLSLASPASRAALINSRHLSMLPGVRSAATTNIGSADPTFIRQMLSHTRGEAAGRLHVLPAGVSDVRLFRVWVTGALNNIRLTHDAAPPRRR